MTRLVWGRDLETGVREIDAQHREIILRLETLREVLDEGLAREEILRHLGFLVDYTRRHFSMEEAIMFAFEYPHLSEHKQAHENFAREMQSLAELYEAKEQALVLSAKLGTRVTTWYYNHLTSDDRRMAEFIRQNRTQRTG